MKKKKADRRREREIDREKGIERERGGRKEGRGKRRREEISGGGAGTYVDLGHGDVNEGAEDNDEIKTVPGVSEIILK